jgi:hypothetical protein
MTLSKILFYIPVAGMVINVIAVAGYLYLKDYPRSCYWLLAAGLTLTTFFMRGR